MFVRCSHPNVSTFSGIVSATGAIFSPNVSWAGAMFVCRRRYVFESLHLHRHCEPELGQHDLEAWLVRICPRFVVHGHLRLCTNARGVICADGREHHGSLQVFDFVLEKAVEFCPCLIQLYPQANDISGQLHTFGRGVIRSPLHQGHQVNLKLPVTYFLSRPVTGC
jgi:hypothetical protein